MKRNKNFLRAISQGQSLVRVGPKHQVTIPHSVFRSLNLTVGDQVGFMVTAGRAMMTPQRIVAKIPAQKLSFKEQHLLSLAQRKIKALEKNFVRAKGLTQDEAKIAAKVGLIDPEQIWWWLEEWQEGEREASQEVIYGRGRSFRSAKDFLKHLEK